MASLAILRQDVFSWLKRRDIEAPMGSWIRMTETDIGALLRARCMIARAYQPVDAAFISLPSDWASMESVRWRDTGDLLDLEDAYTGPAEAYSSGNAVSAYRMVGNCIEFLPHPKIPDPPDPAWAPRQIQIAWYQKPAPLVNPQDTNAVLENHYAVYLWGVLRYGATYANDDARQAQMETAFGQAVNEANLAKQASDYSGAPLRAVVNGF